MSRRRRSKIFAAIAAGEDEDESAAPEGEFNATWHATTSDYEDVIDGASAGDLILLAAGTYGPWLGTDKAITLAPEPGENVTMQVGDLRDGEGGWTIDGCHTEISVSTNGMVREALPFSSTGITLEYVYHQTGGTPHTDITIRRCWFTETFSALVDVGSSVLNWTFDRCYFDGLDDANVEAALQVYGTTVLIKNCLFNNLTADGVKLSAGTGHTVQDCEFRDVNPHGGGNHTDCIQQNGATGGTFVRNFFVGFEQGIGIFDGTASNVITDNVLDNRPEPAVHWITMGADNPASTVNHNTVWGDNSSGQYPSIVVGSKPAMALSISSVKNNIIMGTFSTAGIAGGSDGVPTDNDHNMFSGATAPNIDGTPTFVGGASPDTYQGFKLTSGSAGRNAASDAADVGARIS